jgi:methylsterol monooxygenase
MNNDHFVISRLLHIPLIYKHVHKLHHEWTAPIGIEAVYAHPFEYVFSNLHDRSLSPG